MARSRKSRPTLPSGEKILTFDVSSSGTGFAFGSGGVVLKYGKYCSTEGDCTGRKLLKLAKWVSQVINGLPAPPEVVFIELPFLRQNPHVFSVLSKFVGTVEREVYRILNIQAHYMSPTEVKNALKMGKSKGHAGNKKAMVRKINQILGLDLKYSSSKKGKSKKSDDDIADSLAMLLAIWLKNGITAQNDNNDDF
jgi:Holliday junction resolvasome RuvABC endonuclease subunit